MSNIRGYVNYTDEQYLATTPKKSQPADIPLLHMVHPEPPKLPYLAYHNGETWIKVLGIPITDQGEPIDYIRNELA